MSKSLHIFTALLLLLTLVSCKKEKQTDDIIVDRVVEKKQNAPQAMEDYNIKNDVKWINGATYHYDISRHANSNSVVENHDTKYYDNSVTLTVTRTDGTTFFQKTFGKENFAPVLTQEFKDNGVLLGINFDHIEGNVMYFTVCVGSPDETNEEFYYVYMTLDNFGTSKALPYTGNMEPIG